MTYGEMIQAQIPSRRISRRMSEGGLRSMAVTALRIYTSWTRISSQETIITLDEASWHDRIGDCWIIIYDRVYDITEFLEKHPGGADVLLEYAGRDATVAFRGTGHSQAAITSLQRYCIGKLPQGECIYRKPGGINLSDLPD